MRTVSNTITRLTAQRARSARTMPQSALHPLTELKTFGSNPGALRAWYFIPPEMKAGAPLVVVLHGCTQNAAGFDRGTGWSELAREYGFAVLLPEQTRANNFNLCFNWYEPGDSHRGAGEPRSITQMVDAMVADHGIDPARVFITGLSAGGAMTSVMLATYPEIFAGGAIVAGLPYGSARSVPEAFDRMRGHGGPTAAALAASIRDAAPSIGSWPSVAVWHGTQDSIVDVSNGSAIVEQWRRVHGAGIDPDLKGSVDGYPHRAWRGADGRIVLEEYLITGMGHGTPLATSGDDACGSSGPYMLDVAISSTRHIASAWGITEGARLSPQSEHRHLPVPPVPDVPAVPAVPAVPQPVAVNIGAVIEGALRSAGLMR